MWTPQRAMVSSQPEHTLVLGGRCAGTSTMVSDLVRSAAASRRFHRFVCWINGTYDEPPKLDPHVWDAIYTELTPQNLAHEMHQQKVMLSKYTSARTLFVIDNHLYNDERRERVQQLLAVSKMMRITVILGARSIDQSAPLINNHMSNIFASKVRDEKQQERLRNKFVACQCGNNGHANRAAGRGGGGGCAGCNKQQWARMIHDNTQKFGMIAIHRNAAKEKHLEQARASPNAPLRLRAAL
jgi:hypothetical protein